MCAFYPFLIAVAALRAAPRNAHAQALYVAVSGRAIVSEYATTGDLINAGFITDVLTEDLALLDNTLFVRDAVGNKVGTWRGD